MIAELTEVLAAAGPAHHRAYIETNGFDPEWPLWYANHLADDVRRIMRDASITVSHLVYLLIDCDMAHRSVAPTDPWPPFYAQRMAVALAAAN